MEARERMTMSKHLEKAAEAEQRARESFERSDTDGFMTQWAAGVMANVHRLEHKLEEQGGKAQFPALFDLEGNPVPAKLVETRYGMAWGLLESDDPNGRFVGWVNPSKANSKEKRAANLAKKGYVMKRVWAPARVDTYGANAVSVSAAFFRTDGGFDPSAEVVEDED